MLKLLWSLSFLFKLPGSQVHACLKFAGVSGCDGFKVYEPPSRALLTNCLSLLSGDIRDDFVRRFISCRVMLKKGLTVMCWVKMPSNEPIIQQLSIFFFLSLFVRRQSLMGSFLVISFYGFQQSTQISCLCVCVCVEKVSHPFNSFQDIQQINPLLPKVHLYHYLIFNFRKQML